MRLTKFNPETGRYEYISKPTEYVEYRALTLAALQKLGEYEGRAEGEWKDRYENKYANHYYECSVCGKSALYTIKVTNLGNQYPDQVLSEYCPNCGARMKGADDEQR